MIAEERETTVAYSDADETIHIYSCIRKDITAMRKKDQFSEVETGTYEDGTEWAVFAIDRGRFDIGRAAKATRNLSPEQRAEAARRLTQARLEKKENADG